MHSTYVTTHWNLMQLSGHLRCNIFGRHNDRLHNNQTRLTMDIAIHSCTCAIARTHFMCGDKRTAADPRVHNQHTAIRCKAQPLETRYTRPVLRVDILGDVHVTNLVLGFRKMIINRPTIPALYYVEVFGFMHMLSGRAGSRQCVTDHWRHHEVQIVRIRTQQKV